MKEIVEFWMYPEYADQLFKPNEWLRDNGAIKVIKISRDDLRWEAIKILHDKERKNNGALWSCWDIDRQYTKEEIMQAQLFHLSMGRFHTAGEECGTKYDEATACPICGANAKQVTPLHLYKNKIPKRDIAKSLGGEMIVSDRFVEAVKARGLKGLFFRLFIPAKTGLSMFFN